jgi:hypothetical protein
MRIRLLFLIAACALRASPVSADCDRNYKPDNFRERFEIIKTDRARLKCDWDENNHKIDPAQYIDASGCYIDLRIIGKRKVKESFGAYHVLTSEVHLYANGALCDRKAGDRLALHIGETHCCEESKIFLGCQRKGPSLNALGGDPKSPYDMRCMAGRWVVYENIYPK